MKASRLFRVSIKELFSLRKIWLATIIYCLVILTCLLVIARKGSWSDRGIFDVVADVGGAEGSMNHYMLFMAAIPVIVTILTQLLDRHEHALFVMSYGSRFRTWHSHVISAVCLAFVLVFLMMAISFAAGGILVGWENTWLNASGTIGKLLRDEEQFQSISPHIATSKIIVSLFVTKFLGFMMISFSVLFLRQLTKSSALIMIVLIGLAGLDQSGALQVPVYTWMATLSIKDWLDPMVTIYHSIYLVIVSLVLYGVTGWLYERKDFLS